MSAHKLPTRFLKDMWQAFSCRSLGAPIPTMLAQSEARTKCDCEMSIDSLRRSCHTFSLANKHMGAIHGFWMSLVLATLAIQMLVVCVSIIVYQ